MREFPASPITAVIDEKPLYNLSESVGPDLTVADVLDPETLAGLGGVGLGYGTSAGGDDLRSLVAARHGIPAGQVLITSGAAAALFLLGLVYGDGDVVIGVPCFPPVLDALRATGARVETVRSRFEDGYRLDLGAFRAKLNRRTRLVMLASPQNPSAVSLTGRVVEQVLAAISRACPEAVLLIDETFREASYADEGPAASFAGRDPRLVTCGSLSKAYGVPGLRIGWLTVSDPAAYDQLRLAKFNSAVACGSLDEFLAARVLAQADQVLAVRGAIMATARDITGRWVHAHEGMVRWLRPEAGAFCCVRLEPAIFGPQEIDRLYARLAQERIIVAQGPWFADTASIIRLGMAYEPPGRLEKALELIVTALEASAHGTSADGAGRTH
ncbi:MAG: pyridoxal phosphate-dependent aminotransferase [Streptosporangiaceae bacterium]